MKPRTVNRVSQSTDDLYYITLNEARAQLRVDNTNEDTLITALISVSLDIASQYLGYTIQKGVDEFYYKDDQNKPVYPMLNVQTNTDMILRVTAPVQTLTSVQYYDSTGALNTCDYIVPTNTAGKFGMDVHLNQKQSDAIGDSYLITATTGWHISTGSGDTTDTGKIFPLAIKQACLMIITNLFENRQDDLAGTRTTPVPMGSKYLLNPYKIDEFI